MNLVASMIVRNELDRYLPLAVEHLLTFCDQVRVLDDNSDDGTFEWLQQQNCVEVKRNWGDAFFEYESRARQNLLEWTMEASPEYVLSIDADEFVADPDGLIRALERGGPVYTLDMCEVWGATSHSLQLRMDGQWGPRKCPILWKAPAALDDFSWMIPDRKLACGREPLAVRRGGFQPSGVRILHFGWTRTSERESRAQRYYDHDQGKFHQDKHLQSILWPPEMVKLVSEPWPQTFRHMQIDMLGRIYQ